MRINLQPVSNVIGIFLIVLGILMFFCAGVGRYYNSGDTYAFVQAATITMFLGAISWKYKFSKKEENITKREGYLIVAFAWFFICILSALPYYISGVTDAFIDAIFEATSGVTTTGATIFNDIESLPQGILLWRSLTQWIGGLGIVVLTVALFPILGIAGIELFVAEAPGPITDKIHPRIKETAKRLWYIYSGLTLLAAATYYLCGMEAFDAFNHALTSLSTGGFSTKNISLAYFDNPILHYFVVLFMALGGTNFMVLYFLLKFRWARALKNEEFRTYIIVLIILSLLILISLLVNQYSLTEENFRHSLFTVVSLTTTTGYVLCDYGLWPNVSNAILFMIFFCGACAGSTSGGIKIIRHTVFFKNSILEFKRILHPRAMIRIKINKELVAPRILTHILVFLLIYLFVFFVGFVSLTLFGIDLLTAAGLSASAIGNIGPAFGEIGAVNSYSSLPVAAKWTISFLMIIGRLELFTVLVLFTPFFWRVNA